MLQWLLFAFAALLVSLYIWRQQDRPQFGFLDKTAYQYVSAVVFVVAIYFLYLSLYFWQIGWGLKAFSNCGSGVTYITPTANYTFFDGNDVRVGEYLSDQKAESAFITVMSPLLQLAGFLFVFWFVWHYGNLLILGKNR